MRERVLEEDCKTSQSLQRLAADVAHALMVVLTVLILATTIIIANQDDYRYPNTASLPNAAYYLIAAALICVLVLTLREWLAAPMDQRRFYVLVATIAALTAIAQLVVSLWIPMELSADFATVRTTALGIASGGTFDTSGNLAYFQRYENNINITILFSWIVQLTGHWRCVVYLGALLVNASVVLAALTLVHITGNRRGVRRCGPASGRAALWRHVAYLHPVLR